MSINLKKILDEEPVIATGVANLLVMAGVLTSEQANLTVKVSAGVVAVLVQVVSFLLARRKVTKPSTVKALAAAVYVGKHEVPVATPEAGPQTHEQAAP